MDKLLSLSDAKALSNDEVHKLFSSHINPSLGKMMKMLGFTSKRPIRAEGTSIFFDDGCEVTDFTAQFGIMNVGHNHPRILKAREEWAKNKELEVWKFFPSPYQAALAKNLATIFPDDLDISFFCNSGAEANEGALKMASKVAGADRPIVVHTDISFHGKTHATLSVSGSESKQNKHFKLLPDCVSVPFGDIDALEKVFTDNKPLFGKTKVSTFIVEAIRAEGVHVPPDGYLQEVRRLCDDFNVTLILDEVFTGFGRTGEMFAFNHSGITPDIVTFSKTFGGGKATFGGYVARRKLFEKAYGSMNDATLHSTTYNGYGEEILSAIEVINILHEENLIEKSRETGKYLLEQLNTLKEHHPLIKEVKCVGLLCCVRFENSVAKLAKLVPGKGSSHVVSKLTTGGIISQLFENHNILAYTPPHDFDLLFLTPPLTITKQQIDELIIALNQVLGVNFSESSQVFLKRYMQA